MLIFLLKSTASGHEFQLWKGMAILTWKSNSIGEFGKLLGVTKAKTRATEALAPYVHVYFQAVMLNINSSALHTNSECKALIHSNESLYPYFMKTEYKQCFLRNNQ